MGSNAEALRAAHQTFNARDMRGCATGLLAANATVVDHGRGETLKGIDEFVGWLESFVETSSDIKLVDASYIDAGDHVTAQFRAVGTQDGPIGPFPASGNPYSLDVCEVWRFGPDGKAVEGHNYSDGLGMLIQLGHVPPPQ